MKEKAQIQLVECPRDAMQGLHTFIPTEKKARYLQQLLEVGFDAIDGGSFVSPKAIPQMRDTAEVFGLVDWTKSKSKLSVIVANTRGANDAVKFTEVDYLGFPFSVSETFQLRNTNSTIADSLERVKRIQEIATTHNKELLIYLSMGFGNPYGDPWGPEVIGEWMEQLVPLGIRTFALSDTIGVAKPDIIKHLFEELIPAYPDLVIGAHFHTTPTTWREKVQAAWESGCRRFDGAIKGYGGCPMAKDDLTGNMATENILAFCREEGIDPQLKDEKFYDALQLAGQIFPAN